ncbi:MAG: hypothetical protein QME58_13455 [Bacteroidota bacterium]|nr:hypothetical protein [Bacteroidota bacterium]
MNKKNIRLIILVLFTLTIFTSCKKDGPVDPSLGVWRSLGLEGKLVPNLVFIENYLYATAGRDGLYRINRSTTNAHWEYIGLADTSIERSLESGVTDVVSMPGNLLASYVAGYQYKKHGVYRTSDNGSSWLPSDSGMITTLGYPTASQVLRLEVSQTDPSIIIAGTSVSLVYKSSDGGVSWQKITGTIGASAFNYAIRLNPLKPYEIWIGGETGRFAPFLHHSTDIGATWNSLRFPPNIGPYTYDNAVYDIAVDQRNDSVLYFGMVGAIVKTKDKAQTFQRVLGWEDGIYRNWRLAINPNNPDEIFATGFYLYRTTDGGQTWLKIKPPYFEIYALAVDWQKRLLFVSVSSPENGIYKYQF